MTVTELFFFRVLRYRRSFPSVGSLLPDRTFGLLLDAVDAIPVACHVLVTLCVVKRPHHSPTRGKKTLHVVHKKKKKEKTFVPETFPQLKR